VVGALFNTLKTSRHWTLPAPSQREFNGASRYRRGSGDSSMYPFPPKHSKASATTEGARFVIQYLAIAVAILANFCSNAFSAERSKEFASRIASVVAASDSKDKSAKTFCING